MKQTATPQILTSTPIPVRWRDMDLFGHVNNGYYLAYLEEARVQWLAKLMGNTLQSDTLPVVAAANLNYRLPIQWPDTVIVELFIERLGNTSLTIGHRITSQQDNTRLYSDGNVVMVWMDTQTGKAAPIPDNIRNACQ